MEKSIYFCVNFIYMLRGAIPRLIVLFFGSNIFFWSGLFNPLRADTS